MAGGVEITSSSSWIRGMVNMFASQGVDSRALFDEAGMPFERLKHPHERFSSEDVSRLWAIAVRMSGNPSLGLERGLARRYAKFDLAVQAMWHGPTLRDGLEGLTRYLQLISDASGFVVEPDLQDAWLVLSYSVPGVTTPRQRTEYGLLALLTLCQKVTRYPLNPLAMELVFPEPADFHPYRMAFQCPLRFGQPRSAMKLSRDDLQRPIHSSAETLSALQDRVIESRLQRLGHARTVYRASEEIIRRLHLGEPQPRDIATSVGLAEREFDKRLKSEGQAFGELVDDVRKELASHYLSMSSLQLTQVAGLLGWEGTQELGAACRRWFGKAPAQMRLAS